MFELLTWWNKEAANLSPVLSSAIVHYRFEAIHPFADGNGRTGRALALWELYRRGFDTHHIFSVDEFYWENRPRYYEALDAVRREGEDLTQWLDWRASGHLSYCDGSGEGGRRMSCQEFSERLRHFGRAIQFLGVTKPGCRKGAMWQHSPGNLPLDILGIGIKLP